MTDTRKVLFFVEGFTDIRFVVGLSQISNLTLCVPADAYASSGLRDRVRDSGATLHVVEIPGSRAQFQARSLRWLWRHAREFDAIVSQEVLRGSVNATLVGRLRGVPVITYMAIAPVEYFRCRHQRGQIGWAAALLGEAAIRGMMTFNGRLATRSVALGPYLREIAARYSEPYRHRPLLRGRHLSLHAGRRRRAPPTPCEAESACRRFPDLLREPRQPREGPGNRVAGHSPRARARSQRRRPEPRWRIP